MNRKARSTTVDEAKPASANYHANALARGLAMLEMLAAAEEPLTVAEFSAETGLPKSTLVRLLGVLSEMEYVVRVDERPGYRLGHKVYRLSNAYLSSLDLSVVADDHLGPLADRTGQTANLGLLDGDQVIHVGVHEPDRPIRYRANLGYRDHAYCTGLGKLLLAYLDEAELDDHLPGDDPYPRFTEHTITARDEVGRELKRIRGRGYAYDDNERGVGLRCLAVPVVVDDVVLAAVSVSGPSGEFDHDRQTGYLDRLRETAAELADNADAVAALQILHRSLRATEPTQEQPDV